MMPLPQSWKPLVSLTGSAATGEAYKKLVRESGRIQFIAPIPELRFSRYPASGTILIKASTPDFHPLKRVAGRLWQRVYISRLSDYANLTSFLVPLNRLTLIELSPADAIKLLAFQPSSKLMNIKIESWEPID